ncbi:putative hemolysin [Saccharomonospora amisosensis]|uniref:Putative hemolysin n=1 Tax=Saccharomonospora amisosensis TaxID=1128677 RepID=A0A7X5ZQA5_9PSEU|nr:GNAT family N-acyltransferase [Saccharomonospora amisosensis]NIJ11125.1 putative hemolysin [Saccharomonospora amisosensis]
MTRSQLLASTDRTGAGNARYSLLVAHDNDDVLAAQRLRHQVFAGELGARLHTTRQGVDADYFDDFCDHLVVRDDNTGEIVGTYRMLPPRRAAEAGQLYADLEFDLSSIDHLRPGLVETGRSCVHADHRSGAVVGLVWAGIARYMLLSGHRYLAGCASVPLADGGIRAAQVWDLVSHRHYAPAEHRVTPLRPWDTDTVGPRPRGTLPPLLRGYVRLGAKVCGPPAYDRDFDVADFFVLLDLQQVDERYLKFFLGAQV